MATITGPRRRSKADSGVAALPGAPGSLAARQLRSWVAMPTRMLLVLVSAIFPASFAALSSSPARAAETGEKSVQTPPLKQEIAGLELAPFLVGSGSSALGVGVTLRLGRHRWPGFYWTPVQGGFFRSNDHFDYSSMVK